MSTIHAPLLSASINRWPAARAGFERQPERDALTTISALSGYELVIADMIADCSRVAVELSETVDDGDLRLHTDEIVLFDVADGLIARVTTCYNLADWSAQVGTGA